MKWRLFLWRNIVRWYHFACRVERGLTPERHGWFAIRLWHRVAVYWPLVLSFKVWPSEKRGQLR
jgi:hypothetical protein